jgi:double-stranded uracil-DNA glycosylase
MGGVLPDLLGDRPRLLFVGVNPPPSAVAVQAPFSSPSNRFFPALFEAGITDRLIVTRTGLAAADRAHLEARGIGITALVARPTRRAADLAAAELVAGVEDVTRTVERTQPVVVAFLGVSGYRIALRRPMAVLGRQPTTFAGAESWIVPNPSGRNAHASRRDLARAYREVAVAAGLDVKRGSAGLSPVS